MEKFILTLTKGNNKTVLSVCDTKDEAITEGNEFSKHLSMDSGFLAVVCGEVDSDNNFISGKYKLCHGWL